MTKRKNRSPNENELLLFAAMRLQGASINFIAKETGWDNKTVRKYLDQKYYTPIMLKVLDMVARHFSK